MHCLPIMLEYVEVLQRSYTSSYMYHGVGTDIFLGASMEKHILELRIYLKLISKSMQVSFFFNIMIIY